MSAATGGHPVRVFLQEFSIPLIAGVVAALAAANMNPEGYAHLLHLKVLFGYDVHFLVNDIFMVLFFGIAAKEIAESCLPGGALNPPSKAINPLFGTIGGVLGPVAVYFGLVHGFGQADTYARGWGIPTATDIALAWLVARMVFGKGHPAVNFLLLLAVADDAIGLGIIAIFYPDAAHPVQPAWLALTAVSAGVAYAMRRMDVRSWPLYLLGPGVMSWVGLHSAHLHPALALVFVVPFMPHGRRDQGLFAEEVDEHGHAVHPEDTLNRFEHSMKAFVDFGLFFFAFANAGVMFSDIGPGTWYVLAALLVGKTVGITACSWVGIKCGFPLPEGMNIRSLAVAGMIAGLGLTVALFVAGEAFTGTVQAEAKMGALFSAGIAFLAIAAGRALRVRELDTVNSVETVDPSAPEATVLGKPAVEAVAEATEATPEAKEVVQAQD